MKHAPIVPVLQPQAMGAGLTAVMFQEPFREEPAINLPKLAPAFGEIEPFAWVDNDEIEADPLGQKALSARQGTVLPEGPGRSGHELEPVALQRAERVAEPVV